MSAEARFALDASRLPRPILGDHPEWVELHDFAWQVAARNVKQSRGRWHLDTAWCSGAEEALNYQWVWDTCFSALYARYSGGALPSVESLDLFYEYQGDDGFISMTYDFTTGEEPYPGRINPPLFAWVEWEYYASTGDSSRFANVVPTIERLMAWIQANRTSVATGSYGPNASESDQETPLYWFADCGSSGMDDSPRTPRLAEAGRFYNWIDLSCQMALSFDRLARMHRVLGDESAAAHWHTRARRVGERINAAMWSPRSRFYHDVGLPRRLVSTKTVAGFWPLLAGICPAARIESLVEHLLDEREFNRPMPVPSLSADDPNYSEEGHYWVGGVWAPTNYMVTRGLALTGQGDLAHSIASKYIHGLCRTWREVEPHTLWESYAPEAHAPGLRPYDDSRVKPDFCGWSAIGPIAMLIENIIGIEAQLDADAIRWDIRLTEEHGVEQLWLGDTCLRLVAAKRAASDSPVEIDACSSRSVSLTLRCAGREQVCLLQPDTPVHLVI